MATETLRKVQSDALMLPEAERAELAHELIKSLDAPADTDVADAWVREIPRRLAEIDSGTAQLIDRSEFRPRMRAIGHPVVRRIRILQKAAEESIAAAAWYERERAGLGK